jgi:hypothetical protein
MVPNEKMKISSQRKSSRNFRKSGIHSRRQASKLRLPPSFW